ncbi:16S rRNA (guanine527-N7)-methyltransferase [Flexibacter flexilis DSM 6793]|uniref:Ribosomal RNA small subunit methyltransferase G n=1 Tax=Flexibacter flexilis DSM 6793 TaxID=927664 RepID=A0A1I1J440_9BACT|nr:16S rRNA (guanine(527)-N(7))-methyltransferase RsmG [Flexibacter flexilis]SFC42792.1 16S rRNA (guanine527-N7)-methyltransferase [Flexibacter flexilis DSM 6793]
MEILLKYFPELTAAQQAQFARLQPLYEEWNSKINVISRKDMEHFYERHVLHSLGIAKVMDFKEDTHVLDLGTGGGFPGIPLAIMYPKVQFHLVDSIGKKITVVQAIAEALALPNVKAEQARVESLRDHYDFVVSRAVAPMTDLQRWTHNKFNKHYNNKLKNGIICLKGGDLAEELAATGKKSRVFPLNSFFEEEFFETKKVVYMAMI